MAISKLGPLKTNLFIGLAETLGYLGSAYASLNNPRKETLKYVISLSAGFSFFVVIYPFLFVANASTDPDAYEHFNYSLMMMVLIMARICLSFGFSFLNVKKNPFIFNQVYVLEVFPTSIRHYALSFLVFLTEFVFIFFDSYTAFCHALGIHSSLGIGVALLAGFK
jgi:OCT family organic cation transporter-like MFS transporter 4/5